MAVLDADRGVVVVRIVYDGPPHAGKTTSVRSLGKSLARPVHTPVEVEGRTVFFDWMEYTGGLFEGHKVSCQIVSVPGQLNLAPRRKALLLSADAVVFVADTGHREATEQSAEYVAALSRLLQANADPPIGVVVQANKRDLETAVSRADIRRLLGDAVSGIAVTESVAHEGSGIRETFVFAVRLALDRVRDLVARGCLPRGKPEVENAEDLLASLERRSPVRIQVTPRSDVDPAPASATVNVPPSSVQSMPTSRAPSPPPAPLLPDSRVPSGAIWPAVDGRMMLHEATSSDLTLRRGDGGDWVAGIGTGWRIHSAAGARYGDVDRGREAVRLWARAHASRGELLSPGRCVVVAESGGGEWRLWQIVRVAPSFREWLVELARTLDLGELVDALATASRMLVEAMASPHAAGLATTFDTIGRGERGPQFVALMPGPSALFERAAAPPSPEEAAVKGVRQLEILLARDLWDHLEEIRRALGRGWAPALRDEWGRRVLALATSPSLTASL